MLEIVFGVAIICVGIAITLLVAENDSQRTMIAILAMYHLTEEKEKVFDTGKYIVEISKEEKIGIKAILKRKKTVED